MAASLPHNHEKLYFDTLCRTLKGESVLSLIHATYQAKIKNGEDVKNDISQKLKSAYELFKGTAGTYDGSYSQFQSQYTIGHELCIWKNSELDLTDLAKQVAIHNITIRQYFDIVFLNYIQPINNVIVHILYHLLKYMDDEGKDAILKKDLGLIYMNVANSNFEGEVNGAFNMLLATSYFETDNESKTLKYVGKESIKLLISKCNIRYVEKGYETAKSELSNSEEYIRYLHNINNDQPEISCNILEKGENILVYGAPGVGKSYYVKELIKESIGDVERTVFHPDYTYTDFVGQIMPSYVNNVLGYEFQAGVLTRILKKAFNNKDRMHYLVIEEINRGNASSIFGEIFQLLDRDVNGKSEYGITNNDMAKEIYGNSEMKIFLPTNLTILATMNTSDQNVFSIDTAFQRRWSMKLVNIIITEEMYSSSYLIEGTNVTWGKFVETVNGLISNYSQELLSTEDKRIGPYFVRAEELKCERFSSKVLKYLWDDAFKMNREVFFKKELKTLEQVINNYRDTTHDKLEEIMSKETYEIFTN